MSLTFYTAVTQQLTGGVGTMKRNRQLRDLVDNHNQNYEDDYFDSTPFKQTQPLKVSLINWLTIGETLILYKMCMLEIV